MTPYSGSGLGGGPPVTLPLDGSKVPPWQGHRIVDPVYPTVHGACVQVALNALH